MTTSLPVDEFGRRLVISLDLDPIYVGLSQLDLGWVQLNRWLLTYWCLYDAGSACWIAEAQDGVEFWTRLRLAAENRVHSPLGQRFRRGAERRHWRGSNAKKSLDDLESRYGSHPEHMAEYCASGWTPSSPEWRGLRCADVVARVSEHNGFGPWIGFKVADMAERVMGIPVTFDAAEVFFFDAPAEGARIARNLWLRPDAAPCSTTLDRVELQDVVQSLLAKWSDLKAPPALDRPVGIQEVETVLCKWKSHLAGHYPVGKDTREINEHLAPWIRHSKLAASLLEAMPKL